MSSKRKHTEDQNASSGEESDGSFQDIIDVDFDFYNPEEIDYQAFKRLLGQLFSSDTELIETGDIADILIEENHVGTTIKVDGQESDPYAILSVVNLKEQKENKGIKSLCDYLSKKCPKKDAGLHDAVMNILSLENNVGWVVSERFINMPVEVMPPMYNLLRKEMKNAIDNGESYSFEWFMFISKVYKEVTPTVDEENEDDTPAPPPSKKKKGKKSNNPQNTETFYFQAEDEIIASYATHQFDFKFTNSEKESASDSKRAFSEFGIAASRKLLFIHHSKFNDLVDEIEKTCSNIDKAA